MARLQDWQAVLALAALILLAGAATKLYQLQKAGFFFIGFSAATLVPVSNLLFPIGTILAERLLYLPAIGFAACLVLVYAGARRLGLGSKTAAACLVAILAAWGVRTAVRNLDWINDETLWTSAMKASPGSFKPHLGVAEIWRYSPAPGHSLDDVIAESEKAMAIISDLPPQKSANNVYAQLGDLYRQKGDMLAPIGMDGMPLWGSESRDWYEKAIDVLTRGVTVDRAVATAMRQQQLARGKRPDQIAPFGLDRLYASLGLANLRLGRPHQAVDAFLQQRRLDPGNAEIYRSISSAQLAAGRLEEAIVALMGAHFVADQDPDTAEVRSLYDRMVPASCAVEKRMLPALNLDCPMVKRDVCAALKDVTTALSEGKVEAWANRTKTLAHERYGCAMESLNR
jgi:tetratricopeptide (TPR) repeat protein